MVTVYPCLKCVVLVVYFTVQLREQVTDHENNSGFELYCGLGRPFARLQVVFCLR